MKKVLKIIGGIFLAAYVVVAIVLTVLLLNYNKYNVTEINGNTFTSTVDIDYEKIDTEKLISIDSSNSQLIKNGKIDINDIKNIYESIGATCK